MSSQQMRKLATPRTAAPAHRIDSGSSRRRGLPRRLRAMVIALLASTLAACTGPAYLDRRAGDPGAIARALQPVVFEVGPELERTPPRCIAVLPFETVAGTNDEPAGHAEHVRRAIYAHLAPRAPRDIELGRVEAALTTLSLAQRRDHALIGRTLGCDSLLIGTVTDYRQRFWGLYSDVAVGAQLELIRANDGEVLWEARHVASSRGGGLPTSPLGVISGAVEAIANFGGEQLERITDDLARRLVSTLPAAPEPAQAYASAAPADDASAGRRKIVRQPAHPPQAGGLI